jgi:hypothetical protein
MCMVLQTILSHDMPIARTPVAQARATRPREPLTWRATTTAVLVRLALAGGGAGAAVGPASPVLWPDPLTVTISAICWACVIARAEGP